jgi:hypothetical protein
MRRKGARVDIEYSDSECVGEPFPPTPLLYPESVGKIGLFSWARATFIPAIPPDRAANTDPRMCQGLDKKFLFRHYSGITNSYA